MNNKFEQIIGNQEDKILGNENDEMIEQLADEVESRYRFSDPEKVKIAVKSVQNIISIIGDNNLDRAFRIFDNGLETSKKLSASVSGDFDKESGSITNIKTAL